MKRSEIVALFRERVDDEEQPYLWSDPQAWRYLNDAHRQAAIRARLIRDSSTASVCKPAITAPLDAATAVQTAAAALDAAIVAQEPTITASGDADCIAALAAVTAAATAVTTAADAAVVAQGGQTEVEAIDALVTDLEDAQADLVAAAVVFANAGVTAAVTAIGVEVTLVAAAQAAAILAIAGDFSMSALVREVLRARVSGESTPLTITSADQMDHDDPEWETQAAGTPTHLVIERKASGLRGRVWPAPTTSGTLLMTVTRLPLSDLNTDDDEPEIPAEYHDALTFWMMRCAYLKKDAETYDKKSSEDAESRFTAAFGALIDANVLRKQEDRRPSVVAFQGF